MLSGGVSPLACFFSQKLVRPCARPSRDGARIPVSYRTSILKAQFHFRMRILLRSRPRNSESQILVSARGRAPRKARRVWLRVKMRMRAGARCAAAERGTRLGPRSSHACLDALSARRYHRCPGGPAAKWSERRLDVQLPRPTGCRKNDFRSEWAERLVLQFGLVRIRTRFALPRRRTADPQPASAMPRGLQAVPSPVEEKRENIGV